MTRFFLLAALSLWALASYAQTPTTGGPVPQAPTPPVAEVPLDGGTSLLLAGGVAYGLRRLRKRRQA